jgi:hypothetical protein
MGAAAAIRRLQRGERGEARRRRARSSEEGATRMRPQRDRDGATEEEDYGVSAPAGSDVEEEEWKRRV